MDKELIEHIATQLQNHEENYAPGAWESFAEKDSGKRNGFVFWPLWIAAAIILIFSGLFFITTDKESPKNIIAKSKPKNAPSPIEQPIAEKPSKNNATAANSKPAAAGRSEKGTNLPSYSYKPVEGDANRNKQLNISNPHQQPVEAVATDQANDRATTLANNNQTVNQHQGSVSNQTEKEKPATAKKLTFEDLLAQDSKNNQHSNSNKSVQHSKWQPDVYVAPSMGNDNKLNMNYGFSLSYAIANKLSISSGVSYASISSTESQNASAPQSLSGKNLESIDAKVRGINVPLELRYNISDKLYTGVGVSALAVLNNSQQNTYLVNQVQTLSSPLANGAMESKSFIVAEKQSEPQPTSTIDPDKYIGFYNFSLGYKQKISKKNNIAIEPFLRLPMKTFSRENLNLTNGGLRLKVDF